MKKYIAIFIIALAICGGSNPAHSFDDGDWQYWNIETICGSLTDNLTLTVKQFFMFGDDISEFYESETQFTLGYKVNDWFTIAPGLKHIYQKAQENWAREERLLLDGIFKYNLNDCTILNRARVYYRGLEEGDDVWAFRNFTKLVAPWSWTKWGMSPFFADEFFLAEEQSGIYRNRVYVGLGIKELCSQEALSGAVFFFWQATDAGDDWHDIYVLATDIKIKF